MKAKKITRSTIKSFIKKQIAQDNLYVKCKTTFNGMIDMVDDSQDQSWFKVDSIDMEKHYNFGIKGLWLVGQSRDSFSSYSDDRFTGFEVYNCCGTSMVGMKKA